MSQRTLILDSGSSDELPIVLCKGKRSCIYPIAFRVSYDQLSSPTCSFTKSLDSLLIPKTVHEALSLSRWRKTIIEEVNTLDDNGTWNLVSLPT